MPLTQEAKAQLFFPTLEVENLLPKWQEVLPAQANDKEIL